MSWTLRPDITFLNHGSFGAAPSSVQRAQAEIRARLEAEPVDFFLRAYGDALDAARAALATFVGARSDDLVLVDNATTGVATVVASWRLQPGDAVLALDHGYPACRNALLRRAAETGARITTARLPLPLPDDADAAEDAVVDAVLGACTPETRFALLDQVTSPSALVLPIDRLVGALRERGVETLVDAAHAPGMLPLDLDRTGAAWTTGNLHKWLCAPKGAAFLHLRADLHEDADGALRTPPLVTSHGDRGPTQGRSRLHATFDWCGTRDPSPWLAIPAAIEAVFETHPGGWPERMAANHALAVAMRERLLAALPAQPLGPTSMMGSMAAVRLDDALAPAIGRLPEGQPVSIDPLQDALFRRWRIEVPVIPEPGATGGRYLRVSAQAYNRIEQVDRLVEAVRSLLELRDDG
ncbi:MAG: hypothetical protein RIT45_997 [Pseudomonadota bacterium]